MDGRTTGNHAVGRNLRLVHTEQGGAVLTERTHLVKGIGIDEVVDPLTGSLLAPVTLLLQASLAPAKLHSVALVGKLLDPAGHGVGQLD